MSDIPEDANAHCPGTKSDQAGLATACAGCPNQSACASGEVRKLDPDISVIKDRLKDVKNVILILSGKGGVGKSAVAANLARALATDETKQIGLLDVDICGPSQARIMGVEIESVHESAQGWCPISVQDNLFVMSIAFLLQNRNDAVIWRGPRKNMLIKQFLKDVDWGTLDYLIIDTPPGTSDEHISIIQFLLQTCVMMGALIVTTPQEISLLDVRKEISFCHKTNTRIIGIVENMASFLCPCCSNTSTLFPATTGGAEAMCKEMSTKLLVSLPFDPRITECADQGKNFFELFPESPLCKMFLSLAKQIN